MAFEQLPWTHPKVSDRLPALPIQQRLAAAALGIYLLGFFWLPSGPGDDKGGYHKLLAAAVLLVLALVVGLALREGWRPQGLLPASVFLAVWAIAGWLVQSEHPEVDAVAITIYALQLAVFLCAAQLPDRRLWRQTLGVVAVAAAVAAVVSLVAHSQGWSIPHNRGRYASAWHAEHANLWARYVGWFGLVALDSWRRAGSRKSRTGWGVVTVSLVGCAVATESRSVLLALTLTIATLWILQRSGRILAVLATVLLVVIGWGWGDLVARTDAGRGYIYGQLLEVSAGAPLWGVGPRESDDVRLPGRYSIYSRGHTVRHAHSVPVSVRYHLGWIGFGLFVCMLLAAAERVRLSQGPGILLLFGAVCCAVDGSRLVTSAHDSVWLLLWLPIARAARRPLLRRRFGETWLMPCLGLAAVCWILAAGLALPRLFDPADRPRQLESVVAFSEVHPLSRGTTAVRLTGESTGLSLATRLNRAIAGLLGSDLVVLRRHLTFGALAFVVWCWWWMLRHLRRFRWLVLLGLGTLPATMHLGLGGEPLAPTLLLVTLALGLSEAARRATRRGERSRSGLRIGFFTVLTALAGVAPATFVGLLPAWINPARGRGVRFYRAMALLVSGLGVLAAWGGPGPDGVRWSAWWGASGLWWCWSSYVLARRPGAGLRSRLSLWVCWSLTNVGLCYRLPDWYPAVGGGAFVDAWVAAVPPLVLFIALSLRGGPRPVGLLVPAFLMVSLFHQVEREWSWSRRTPQSEHRERVAARELRSGVVEGRSVLVDRLILLGPELAELERLQFWAQVPAELRLSRSAASADHPGELTGGAELSRFAVPRWRDVAPELRDCAWIESGQWRFLDLRGGRSPCPAR